MPAGSLKFEHMNNNLSWWEQGLQQPQKLRLNASLFHYVAVLNNRKTEGSQGGKF